MEEQENPLLLDRHQRQGGRAPGNELVHRDIPGAGQIKGAAHGAATPKGGKTIYDVLSIARKKGNFNEENQN